LSHYQCEKCKKSIHEDYINTITVVGFPDVDFELCNDCIESLNLIKIDKDNQKNFELTIQEIKMVDDEENIYYADDYLKFKDEMLGEYIHEDFSLLGEMLNKMYKMRKKSSKPLNHELKTPKFNSDDLIKSIRNQLEIQKDSLCNPYMYGLYNGLEMCLATLEERECKFLELDEYYISLSNFIMNEIDKSVRIEQSVTLTVKNIIDKLRN
jgi:hypothetical protein